MKTMKLNIDLGKYVITGTKHDLILSERGIIKEGENAGKETLSRIGYYGKFEHLVKELCNREILLNTIMYTANRTGVLYTEKAIQMSCKTPATDAFLAEIERKAIRKFINSIEHILRDKLSPYDTEEMLEAMRIFLEEQGGEQK
ncbi:hypothetical protein MZD82_14640 [Escherichia coli]|nr:hypothetical protein [Escherichia coli]